MTTAHIIGGDLLATDEPRVLAGIACPFGVVGSTNLGRFSVDKGVFSIPSDVSHLIVNEDHSQTEPRGRFLAAQEADQGIVARLKIAETPEGDALLARAETARLAGKPLSLSVEVKGVVIRDGKAVAGALTGVAFVDKGAFPGASLLAAAVDTIEVDGMELPAESESSYSSTSKNSDGSEYATSTTTTEEAEELGDGKKRITRTTVSVTEITEADAEEADEDPTQEGSTLTANAPAGASVPATLLAGAPHGVAAPGASLSLHELGELLYAARHGQISHTALAEKVGGENGDTLFGALSDVKYNGVGGLAPVMSMIPQWLGEITALAQYKQLYVPLFAHGDLTSLALSGYKWTQKPSGGDWPGNKGDVPSNTLTVAAVTGTASPWAVGHDIAREFIDFPVPGFFEAYAIAVLESYLRWVDAKVIAAVVAGSTALAADALATIPGNPAATTTNIGGTIGTTASAIVDGATVLVTNGILPTFALVAPALWKQMAKIPRNNVLGYLNAALGLDEGSLDGFTIRPAAGVAAGKVLVGAKGAATVYELPGAPIRIDALDLARGGVDKAAFGYAGVVINDPTALQLVTAATA